jgi:hypothetical protein
LWGKVNETKIYLKPRKGLAVTPPSSMTINGVTSVTWEPGKDIAMPGSPGEINKLKAGTVRLSGPATRKWTIDVGLDDLNKDTLDDLLVLMTYKIS